MNMKSKNQYITRSFKKRLEIYFGGELSEEEVKRLMAAYRVGFVEGSICKTFKN